MRRWAPCRWLPGPGKCHPLGFGPAPAPPAHPQPCTPPSTAALVTLVMSVRGFLEREAIGSANTSWSDVDMGAKLKPPSTTHQKRCWSAGGRRISLPGRLSRCSEQGLPMLSGGLRASGGGEGAAVSRHGGDPALHHLGT